MHRFLLAKLHLDFLSETRNPDAVFVDICPFLSNSQIYDHALARIMKLVEIQPIERAGLAWRILSWLTYAARELTSSELQDALAPVRGKRLDGESCNRPTAEDMITACRGLVMICPAGNVIRFLHHTVQEYLVRSRRLYHQISEGYVGESCVGYLGLERFANGVCRSLDKFHERVQLSPLYEYAANYWGRHLPKTLPLSQATSHLLDDRPKLEAACQAAAKPYQYWYSSWKYKFFRIRRASSLAVAAFAGAEAIILAILRRPNVDVNAMDSFGNTALSWAAKKGHDSIVELLLTHSHIDVNHRNYKGCTPLLLGAKAGHNKVVASLLEHGANPKLKNLKSFSPLWYAAEHGHVGVVELLLATAHLRGLNLEVYTEKNTLLSLAARNGHTKVVSLMLSQPGVVIDKPAITGEGTWGNGTVGCMILTQATKIGDDQMAEFLYDQTHRGVLEALSDVAAEALLHCAVQAGSETMVRLLLLEHKVDPNCRSGAGLSTPLMAAVKAGRAGHGVLRQLLDIHGVQPNLRDEKGRTALLLAAAFGNEMAVQILLQSAKVDPHCEDDDGRTALSWAAESLHEGIVEKLLGLEGVEPDHEDKSGRNPLFYAFSWSSPRSFEHPKKLETIVRQLLATGRVYKLNVRGYRNQTTVMEVVMHGNETLLRLFLSLPGTDLNAKDSDGHNLLLIAGSYRRWDMVELLIETGKFDLTYKLPDDPQAWESEGDTIFSMAVRQAPEDTAMRILSRMCFGVNPEDDGRLLAIAVCHRRLSVLEYLLAMQRVVNLNLKDQLGHTPLSQAISAGFEQGVDRLLRTSGINLETRDLEGRTPLSLAAEKGLAKVVAQLLSSEEVNPDSRDNTGRSPLSWAICLQLNTPWSDYSDATTDGRLEVAKLLLQTNKIDLNAEDDEGWTLSGRAISNELGDGILDLLLAREDVDLQHVDAKSRTFLSIAMSRGEPVLIQKVRRVLRICCNIVESEDPGSPGVDDAAGEARARGEVPNGSSRERSPSPHPHTPERYRDGGKGFLQRITEQYMRAGHIPLGVQGKNEHVGEADDGKLCERCQAINITGAFSHRPAELHGKLIAKLGRLDDIQQSCGLCKLMAAALPPSLHDQGSTDSEGEYELRAFSSTNIWLCENSGYCHEKLPTSLIDTVFLAVVATRDEAFPELLCYEPSPSEILMRSGFIGRVGSNSPYRGRALLVRRVMNTGLDTDLIRSWITTCSKRHSEACNRLQTKPIPNFRLIHCASREITIPDTIVPFAALSYVWGAAPNDQTDYTTLSGLSLEPVVEDAIRITASLGYEYLWVDRYCITQRRGTVQVEQIRHMNSVYEGAEVTLIAAAGKDASFGLPGVGRQARNTQAMVIAQGHILTWIPPDPSREVKSSRWATRGWTYQEGLLSRRRLFFTRHEVSFECRELLTREAIELPTRIWERMETVSYEHKPRLQGSSWLFPRQSAVSPRDDGRRLFHLLSEYTSRELTYQSDTLNAMLGIFQQYANLPEPVHHLCGVPITNQHLEPDVIRFGTGLCWRLLGRSRRRRNFPSWSWTGWSGTVKSDTMVDFCGKDWMPRDAMDISIVEPDKGLLHWSEYLKLSNDEKQFRFRQYHVLQIRASVVRVRLQNYHNDCEYWRFDTCIGDDMMEGYFELTKDDTADAGEFRRRLLEEYWLAIVMWGSFLLVVEEQPAGHWERIGIAHISNNSRRYNLEGGLGGLGQRTFLLG